MKTRFLFFACCLFFSFISLCRAEEITLGEVAEQAEKLREALTHYTAVLQSTAEGSADDQRLREKIIQIVQKLDPLPAIPEEAKRRLARGQAAVQAAKDDKGFLKAAEEFRQALREAPWLAEGYYNLGIVQDKAGQYADAIRNLKLYLLAAPNAKDAGEVHNLIYQIEYRMEGAPRAQIEEAETEREKAKASMDRLVGRWMDSSPEMTHYYDLIVAGDTSFRLEYRYSECKGGGTGCSSPLQVIEGSLAGGTFAGTAYQKDYLPGFECRYDKSFPVEGKISEDGRSIQFTLHGEEYDFKSCQWTGRAQTVNYTFIKY